jgi:IclR family transcriptional regulator, acetate operon repressor
MVSGVKNKPAYAIDSVDHALHLVQLLQHEGPLRVTDAAEHLGVSRSTAHRLLAMLVYRDFAQQREDRRYHPGPALQPLGTSEAPVEILRRVTAPHMHNLVSQIGESANVMVLIGTDVRFISTVESDQVLRVGDRTGRMLPAHLASGGKAILAEMPADELGELYAQDGRVDPQRLRREPGHVRKRGFAINDELTETGLTAIGMALRDQTGKAVAALSIAAPKARFSREVLPTWVGAMSETVSRIERDLVAQVA